MCVCLLCIQLFCLSVKAYTKSFSFSSIYTDYDLPSSFAAVWCFSDFWAKKEKAFFETTFKKDFLIFLQTVRQRMREKEKKKKMTKTFPILYRCVMCLWLNMQKKPSLNGFLTFFNSTLYNKNLCTIIPPNP